MQAKLFPFKVESVIENVNEIPKNIQEVECPEIWEKGEKGSGVVVAVLDTGCDVNHPDLKDNIIGGKNFTRDGDSNDIRDFVGHGTHVCGTIGGVENGNGIVGAAPQCKLLICKVLGNDGSGEYRSIINGIDYAIKWRGKNGEKVRVINMSLGGSEDYPPLNHAILRAVDKGILVVVASGNEGDGNPDTDELSYPSHYNECVTVGACDFYYKLTSFSNTHNQVDVIGMGKDVLSTYPNGNYARLSGTSMATPLISGICALIIKIGEKQFKRQLTESEIFSLLVKSCCSIGYDKSAEGNGFPKLLRVFEECEGM